MKNLHTRIIVLNYFEDEVPIHDTKEEQEKWYAALGKMAAYGLYHSLNSAEDDTLQRVSLGFRKNPVEILACYHAPVQQERYETGGVKYMSQHSLGLSAMAHLYNKISSPNNTICMGATLHQDGKWGFHS